MKILADWNAQNAITSKKRTESMKETKKYWKGLDELNKTPEFEKYANKEFAEHLPLENGDGETSRRDFLKMMGFGVAAVSLAACETPIRKAIPYVKKPVDVDPSVPNFYASTYVSGSDVASVVVKTREGRPIKIEGNKLSPTSGGGTTAQIEASVLSLYDKQRLTGPMTGGNSTTWQDQDQAVIAALTSATKPVFLVSNTVSSPSTNKAIAELKSKYPTVTQVSYDPYSVDGALAASEKAFGKRALPSYDFSKAKTIVSFESDFLGNHPSSVLNSRQFAASRKLSEKKQGMSRLYVFESNLSLTGANADYRNPIKPSEQGAFVSNLYNLIASKTGGETINAPAVSNDSMLQMAAKDLLSSKGNSIVISGSNDANIQYLIVAINSLLGAYATTIDIENHVNTRAGSDSEFKSFVNALKSGNESGVIFYNCNPVYDHPLGGEIASALSGIDFSLSTTDRMDETADLVKHIAPDHHFLESWNDYEIVKGKFSLSQPTISNIFDTRQGQDSFLKWSGSDTNYLDFIRSAWETDMYPLVTSEDIYDFNMFWDTCLQDGVIEFPGENSSVVADLSFVGASAGAIQSTTTSGLELVLYQKNAIGSGSQANNPWLHEMPDPITKAVWDNYLTVSPKQAEEWGIELGDMTTQLVNLTANGNTVSVPVMPQPGQAYGTVGLALGYGRTNAGLVADNLGVNAYPMISNSGSNLSYNVMSGVTVDPTDETYRIAQTQTHHTYMGRETVIQETTLKEYQSDPQAGRSFPKIATAEGFKKPYAVSLWKGHEYANHHWGLVVDMNSCTGCGTCTIACQTENNIPVVGKQEVLNRREMHWIRIDRYYSSDAEDGDLRAMEVAAENPEVTFHPMMCQQCNNAPCETVCPVAATTHSTEGLNQMTYNRCIGTRYCANNCPYKVRRFNWFKYHDNDQFDTNLSMSNDLGKMVLNPDVTVRSRGVMEKCSFCVQRIQSGKLEAKKEGRRPVDGEITSACAASCPSDALIFGDLKDPESKISKALKLDINEKGAEAKEPRAYHVLEEIRVMPNVWYLSKVRNKEPKKEEASNA